MHTASHLETQVGLPHHPGLIGSSLLILCMFPTQTVAIPVTLFNRRKIYSKQKNVTAYKGDIIAYYLFDYFFSL